MPHSTDPKLIVPFATEGDPLRQTVDRRKKKKNLGNYTSVEELFCRVGKLSGCGLCEFNGTESWPEAECWHTGLLRQRQLSRIRSGSSAGQIKTVSHNETPLTVCGGKVFKRASLQMQAVLSSEEWVRKDVCRLNMWQKKQMLALSMHSLKVHSQIHNNKVEFKYKVHIKHLKHSAAVKNCIFMQAPCRDTYQNKTISPLEEFLHKPRNHFSNSGSKGLNLDPQLSALVSEMCHCTHEQKQPENNRASPQCRQVLCSLFSVSLPASAGLPCII